MYKISSEKFNVMVEQLLGGEDVSYDMLCYIAEETLRPTVRSWCQKAALNNVKELENDIMQEIHVRLLKTCVSKFLLKNGRSGKVNNDPDGFTRWMFTLASNIKNDCFKQISKSSSNERFFEEDEEENLPGGSCVPYEEANGHIEALKKAFNTVIESDTSVYKILTWVAQSLYILRFDITKIQSNSIIIEQFSNKTLFDMRDILKESAKELPWLEITEKQSKKIDLALNSKWDGTRVIGQVEYREFFMKKGAGATVSDWMNRMNNIVKRAMSNESFNG